MTNENPFAAPELWGEQSEQLWPEQFFVVDGQRILCGRSVQLPPVCVVTGQTQDLFPQRASLCFPWYRLVISQRWVDCHFFVHRTVHTRRMFMYRLTRAILAIGWILLVCPVALTCLGAVNVIGLGPIGGLLLLIGRLLTVLSGSRLKLTAAVDRQRSLISGFSPAFFEGLAGRSAAGRSVVETDQTTGDTPGSGGLPG
ncbi:MAG: hypothetical protein ACKO2P_05595 [Planctomycetota bacterium]